MAPVRRKATVFPYRGKYRVQYLDTFGRQRTKTADTQQAAYQFLADCPALRTGQTVVVLNPGTLPI